MKMGTERGQEREEIKKKSSKRRELENKKETVMYEHSP